MYRFSARYFIDTSAVENIEQSFTSIAIEEKLPDTSAQGCLAWLARTQIEWLLLFDNADDPQINLQDYFPRCNHGNVLVTTRNPDCCTHAPQHFYEVAGLEPNIATELLCKLCGRKEFSAEEMIIVANIVKEVGYLALAIVHAGGYLIQNRNISLKTYLENYKQNRYKNLTRTLQQTTDKYKIPVYTTWEMSHKKLSMEAAKLLQICACFHYSSIPVGLFKTAAQQLENIQEDTNDTGFTLQLARDFLTNFQNDDNS